MDQTGFGLYRSLVLCFRLEDLNENNTGSTQRCRSFLAETFLLCFICLETNMMKATVSSDRVLTVDVFGVRIRCIGTQQVQDTLIRFMHGRTPYSVYIVNVATVNLVYKDLRYRD